MNDEARVLQFRHREYTRSHPRPAFILLLSISHVGGENQCGENRLI